MPCATASSRGFNRDEAILDNRRTHNIVLDQVLVILAVVIVVILALGGAYSSLIGLDKSALRVSHGHGCSKAVQLEAPRGFSYDDVPAYSGAPSAEMNGNIPYFTQDDLMRGPFEEYSDLDEFGRCGPAFALVGPETMPTVERGSIGMVKPSGWQIAEYDWIDGRYLYNRCHLIAYSLASENENELNLITGTRSMNVAGMLPFEEQVASYIDRTKNHVLYRVTPVFEGKNLIASGVLMEAESVEDNGAGVRFCAWCYNVEPGVTIDYATGNNWANDSAPEQSAQGEESEHAFILNTRTFRFHRPNCPSVADMSPKNKQPFDGTREEALQMGYKPCGVCNP